MRVLVIGGTRFIGRRLVEHLLARGDEPVVVHRGRTEPDGLPEVAHLHADRSNFESIGGRIAALRPDAVVDTCAMTAAGVEAVLPHLPDVPLVVLSSCDVYEAYDVFRLGLRQGRGEIAVPLTEESATRLDRYPYRGLPFGSDDYEKLDVEPHYLARGGTALRLGFVYGEHDPQRREEFVLRRVRAGRPQIPIGPGRLLMSRLYVGDASSAVLAALDAPDRAAGQVFDVAEASSPTVAGWAAQILAAAGSSAELVPVPGELPDDLAITGDFAQHMLFSSAKATALLGWQPGDPAATVPLSVRWHLANPPADQPDGTGDGGNGNAFAADDTALRTAG